jgi:xanthine dehydrogenase accessory factor
MLVYDDGGIVGTVGGGAFEHRCRSEALQSIAEGLPRRLAVHLTQDLGMCCGGAMEAFIEPLRARPALVVYGAGHVGQATVRMAAPLGWELHLVDAREEWIHSDALPPTLTRHHDDPRRVLDRLPQGPRALHFVVTHDHALDQDIVETLLPRELGWLGLIASKAKVTRFLLRFRAAGMDPALFSRLRSPVGLDIGAIEPAEIAVSVLAELVQHVRQSSREARPLADAPLPLRDRARDT